MTKISMIRDELQSPTKGQRKRVIKRGSDAGVSKLEIQKKKRDKRLSSLKKRKMSFNNSIEFKVKCTSINNRIKQYVDVLFNKFDDEKDDKLYFPEFEKWTEKHPSMLDNFEKGFFYQYWGHHVDEVTNRDQYNFQATKPEANCYVDYRVGNKSKKEKSIRLWIELHDKFLVLMRDKEDVIPFSKSPLNSRSNAA